MESDGSFPLKTSDGDGPSTEFSVEQQSAKITVEPRASLPPDKLSAGRNVCVDWGQRGGAESGAVGVRMQPSAPVLTETLMEVMSWDGGGGYYWRAQE